MALTMTRLTPADYVTTQWSGGKTTQLSIAPEGAVYAERDFLWRLSSATVELEESDFTALPDYYRYISTLRGNMTLQHNGGEKLTLAPYDIHGFDGADDTHSWGCCTDFNLMLRKGRCEGEMRALRCSAEEQSVPARSDAALVYCAEGACTVRCGALSARLTAGESVLIRGAAIETLGVAGESVCMLALMRQTGSEGAV